MFGPLVEAAAKAHAIAQHPKEACGIVVAGAYLPLDNHAPDPSANFLLPPDWATQHGKVDGIVHSHCHPAHGQEPTAADMTSQIATALPWGIVWTDGKVAGVPVWFGDHLLEEPLFDAHGNHLPRQFLHGVRDCYSLIRCWYWQQRQVKLPEVPRDADWWRHGGDLYSAGFGKAGFAAFAHGPQLPKDAKPGDVMLMKWGRPEVPFHGGVVVESGLILHHRQNQLSRREPLGNWIKYATHWLRHERASGLPDSRHATEAVTGALEKKVTEAA